MKIVKQALICFFLIVIAALGSCKKENMCDCIKRTGDIIVETRNFTDFDRIYVENNVNVFITQDSVFDVKVEAGENIVPLIKIEMRDRMLYISNKNRCNWTRSYKKPLNVYLRMPKVKFITTDGTGDVKSTNTLLGDTIDLQTMNSGNIELAVNNYRVRTHMHGSGDVTLSGITDEHDCSIGGTAYLYAAGLKTDYTYIHTFTLGNSYIYATDLLICRINEKGDIYCTGNPPTIHKEQNGPGHLYLQ